MKFKEQIQRLYQSRINDAIEQNKEIQENQNVKIWKPRIQKPRRAGKKE